MNKEDVTQAGVLASPIRTTGKTSRNKAYQLGVRNSGMPILEQNHQSNCNHIDIKAQNGIVLAEQSFLCCAGPFAVCLKTWLVL